MATCERCWRDARGDAHEYRQLVKERSGRGTPCTPAEQCGEMHLICVKDDEGPRCRCGAERGVEVVG